MTTLNMFHQELTSSGLTTATTAYTAGDVLGSGWTIDWGSETYGFGINFALIDQSDVIGSVDIWIYDASVTFGTDNAAPSISDADETNLIGMVPVPTPTDHGGVRAVTADSFMIGANAVSSGQIFAYAVTNTGHTFFGGTGHLILKVWGSRDV